MVQLVRIGMPGFLIEMLKSIYSSVWFRVKVCGQQVSEALRSEIGLRQGCQLSSYMFSLFVDDLVEFMEGVEIHAPCIGNVEIRVLLYADDVVILSRSRIGLQRALDRLLEYSRLWLLDVQVKKTKVLVCSQGAKASSKDMWFYNKERLEVVRVFNYLGVLFARNGGWQRHTENSVQNARCSVNQVRRKMYENTELSAEVIKRIFIVMIQPVLTYGAEVWGVCYNSSRVDAVAARLLKNFLGVSLSVPNCAVFLEMGLLPPSYYVEAQMLKYFYKIQYSDGKALQKLCLQHQLQSRSNVHWAKDVQSRLEAMQLAGAVDQSSYKSTIKKHLRESKRNELVYEMQNKKSLRLLNQVLPPVEGAKYVKILDRTLRAAMAKFRLGNYIYEVGKRPDDSRICVLCGGTETFTHILLDCPGTTEYRKSLPLTESAIELVSSEKNHIIKALAEFLKTLFNVRKEKSN